jgi:hypothetical protein
MNSAILIACVLLSLGAAQAQYGRQFGGYGGYGGGGYRGGYGGYGGGGYRGGYGGYGGGGYRGGYGGYRYYGRGVSNVLDDFDTNLARCQYIRNESMLSCHGPTSLIECQVVVNTTTDYEFFGLSRYSRMNYSALAPSAHKYILTPRNLNDTVWLNHTIQHDGMVEDLVIYHGGERTMCHGIRVIDQDCYADLSAMFNSIVNKLIVPINGDMKHRCSLFGYVSLV